MTRPTEPSEQRLADAARAFPYPPTPDIARTLRQPAVQHTRRRPTARRQWVLALAASVLVLLGVLAVPPVRAQIWAWLRIGSVEIAVPATPIWNFPTIAATAAGTPAPTRTPRPSPTINPIILGLAGETTLADAQQHVRFPIRLPTYPDDLGQPDRVFVQRFGGARSIILAWLEPNTTDRVRLALYVLTAEVLARKMLPDTVVPTMVNDTPAVWVQGPHLLEFRDRDDVRPGQLVTGNVLIWTQDQLTYRLETGLSLKETVRIAESLR